ncbi:MAG: tyrosine-type recombinase/integrase [Asticcacaulis sp.]|uniref:tyrosine-type recombinase/integrase n=1 Tax=Asticcacaulis sp. TaxID=1872648 RepID=UPI003F7C3390
MPLATVLVRYWQGHASKIASAVQAKIALALWTEFWADATVSDLSHVRQEAFIAWLKGRGYKNAYVSRVLTVGRAALRWAWKRQEITHVPFIIDEKDRSDEKEPYRLTKTEMRKLLMTAQDWPHLFLFMIISLNTLARPGAVLDLGPDQVDFDARLIDLNPPGRKRTKKGRPVVPVTETLLPFLQNTGASRFVNWHGNKIDSIKKGFATVVKAAKLSDEITPYSLRHTMAAELRSRSVPHWEVEGLLGHKMPGVTERYARFAPDYLSKGREAIDAYFAELGLIYNEKIQCSYLNSVALACHSDLTDDMDFEENVMFSEMKMVGATGIEPVTPTMSR